MTGPGGYSDLKMQGGLIGSNGKSSDVVMQAGSP